VQHILASCTHNGTTVVWDLKKQKPVISFRDPNRCATPLQPASVAWHMRELAVCLCCCSQRRASVLQWNPEIATQLIVASDDDRSPTLQVLAGSVD
jgi:protein transport protein SEC31